MNSREFGESVDERLLPPELDEMTATNDVFQTEVLETASDQSNFTEQKWFINADILYWHSKVGGTDFAFANERPTINLPIQGYTKRIDFNWDLGFRVGLGRRFNSDNWSSFLSFTYFKSTDSSQMKGSEVSYLTPLRGAFSHYVLKSKSNFDFGFYNLDADLCRHYFMNQDIWLKPSLGLKNTWVNLKQIVRYNEGKFLQENTAQTLDVSKMWGIGPKASFESSWHLKEGFNVFSLFSFMVQVKENSKITPTGVHDFIIRDRFHRFVPNIQFYLGLGYGTYFQHDKYFLDLKLGYECQYFWRMNQMIFLQKFEDSYRYQNLSEDISMHGITLKIKLSF